MYHSEKEQSQLLDVQLQVEQEGAGAQSVEWTVRIAVLLGFLIVLTLEGWLLIRVLQS
jgi:hypothetical protein